MTKLSQIPNNNTPGLSDAIVSIQTPSGTPADVQVPISKLLALLGNQTTSNVLSSSITTISNGGSGGGTISYIDIGGIKLCWGTGMVSAATAWNTVQFPIGFFSTIPIVTANAISQGTSPSTPGGWVEFTSYSAPASGSPQTTGFAYLTRLQPGGANANNTTINFLALGT